MSEPTMTLREVVERIRTPIHTLVVTLVDGELQYAIECPGVTDACRTWWECMDCQTRIRAGDKDLADQLSENSEAHGVEHQSLECGWATSSEDCWGQEYDDLREAAEDVFKGATPEPGRYRVRLHPDDQYLELELVTDEGERRLDEGLARHEAAHP